MPTCFPKGHFKYIVLSGFPGTSFKAYGICVETETNTNEVTNQLIRNKSRVDPTTATTPRLELCAYFRKSKKF